jgi:hypothetical protein
MNNAPVTTSPVHYVSNSSPPPSQSETRLSTERDATDTAFADVMLARLAESDYAGALVAAEALLEHHPRDSDASDCAQIARSELRKLYVARLGSLARVPHVAMTPEELVALPSLDFRAGFLLARIDGWTSLETIADIGGMSSLEALRILSELYLHRAIAFSE